MDSLVVRRILLPAIAVSSVVFTGLMGWLIQQATAPASVAEVASETGDVQQIITSERHHLAIRHVGIAMIASVATGLAAVELLRKWYGFQDTLETKLQELGVAQSWLAEPLLADEPLKIETDLVSDTVFEPEVALISDRPLPPAVLRLDSPEAVTSNYRSCRISVPQTPHQRWAIVHGLDYYQFAREFDGLDRAIAFATALSQQGYATAITSIKRGYAVWQWEPSV